MRYHSRHSVDCDPLGWSGHLQCQGGCAIWGCICCDDVPVDSAAALGCGHGWYCPSCINRFVEVGWRIYMKMWLSCTLKMSMCHVSDMSQYTRHTCAFVFICMQNGLHLASPHAMLIYGFEILEFRQVLQWVPKNWSEKQCEISPSIYLYLFINQSSYLSFHRPTHFWIDDGSMKHDLTTSQSRHGRHVWTMALLETSHALTVEKQSLRKTWPASWQQIFLFHNLNCVQIFGWNPPHQGHLVIKKLVIVGGLFLRISSPKGIPYVLVDLSSQEASNPKRVGLRTSAETHHFSPPCFQHQSCCSGFGGQTAPLHLGETLRFRWKTELFFLLQKTGGGNRILRISVFVGSDCAFIYRH